MKPDRVFFQDFLFAEVPVDEQDFPVTAIDISGGIRHSDDISLSLDMLLRMNKKDEWNDLFHKIDNCNVCIVDDVGLVNAELEYYKKFYLYTYYINIQNNCKSCYVVK